VHILKWPDSAIRRINFINRKQKSVKGLKFGNRQNAIDDAVTGTEVRHFTSGNNGNVDDDKENLSLEDEHEDEINGNSDDEYEDEINENTSSPEDEDEDDEDNSSPEDDDEDEASEVESVAPENPSREDDDEEETYEVESVAPENRADEVDPLPTTRSGRTYKPYDWAKHFPETAHT